MREIKFRAWDSVMGSWVPMGMNLITELVFIEKSGNSDGKFKIDTFDSESERFILMQFTGIHDKNGKEIYEGDVVRSGMTGENYVICWSDEKSAWYKEMLDNNVPDRPIYQDNSSISIIGNIHENPELLEK